MRPGLIPARSYEPELMDGNGFSDAELAACLRDIEKINRWLGGIDSLRRPLEVLVRRDRLRGYTLLDVGTGGGEVPRALVASARRQGIDARAAGLDLDPRIVRYAFRRSEIAANEPAGRDDAQDGVDAAAGGSRRELLSLLRADGFRLPFSDASFDFVTSSLMFHHFAEDPAARLLAELARVARRAVVVNDLARHRIPWAIIKLLSAVAGSPMVRHDGPLSVLRGWQPAELLGLADAAGLGARARVHELFPYRLVLIVERGIRTSRPAAAVAGDGSATAERATP